MSMMGTSMTLSLTRLRSMPDMLTVWRIEYPNGVGMYRGNNRPQAVEQMYDYERHPSPLEDALLRGAWCDLSDEEACKYKFGFPSLELLKAWIYRQEWRDELKERGLIISVFECAVVIRGDTQCIWKGERLNERQMEWNEL